MRGGTQWTARPTNSLRRCGEELDEVF